MKISQINYVHVSSLRDADSFPWIDYVDFTWGDAVLTLVDTIALLDAVKSHPGTKTGDWDDLLDDIREAQNMRCLIAFDG